MGFQNSRWGPALRLVFLIRLLPPSFAAFLHCPVLRATHVNSNCQPNDRTYNPDRFKKPCKVGVGSDDWHSAITSQRSNAASEQQTH